MPVAELPKLIQGVYNGLAALTQPQAPAEASEAAAERLTPAQVRKSITPDALISFLDGKPYKTLKRHLTKHGLTPEGYRARASLYAQAIQSCGA